MEGKFLKKKNNFWLGLLLLCGLFFIGLYFFINIVDTEATSETLTFLFIGIFICLVVIPSRLLNLGAYIRIDNGSVKAKYGWFDKLDCSFSDIAFASAQFNTLIIQTKDGKTHTIMGIENSVELCRVIRHNLSFDEKGSPEEIADKLKKLHKAKSRSLIFVILGLVLMFANIFITVLLTNERELYEFSKTDWIIMAIMSIIEIITTIATFCIAVKAGKNNVPIEKMQYALQRRIIETEPLLPGNAIKVYTDANYTGRITLFGFPNNDSIYYIIQKLSYDHTLDNVYESELFESVEAIQSDFEEFIDITEKVLQQK